MALYIPKGSEVFHGEFEFAGTRHRFRLDTKVCGLAPSSLKLPGDAAFERSRGQAEAALAELKKEFTDPRRAATRLSRVHELQAGVTLDKAEVSQLPTYWLEARRTNSKMAERHVQNGIATIARFTAYLGAKHPNARDLRAVDRGIAEGFMSSEENRGISPKTYDNSLGFLLAAFRAAKTKCGLSINPFDEIPKKRGHSVHRKPYTLAELKRILAAAKTAGNLGAIVVIAICTGMRRENCVRLRWEDVNLAEKELRLFALKTDEPLFIPILLPLLELLQETSRETEYCFPSAVAAFEQNPDFFDLRLKHFLKGLGFSMTEPSRSTVPRLRKPSVHGYHRFKTSFVTLALNAGIPMEMLQKVVGNTVVDVVMKTYYRPSTESIKDNFSAKLPEFLTGQAKELPDDHLAAAIRTLDAATASSWDTSRSEARKHLMQTRALLKGIELHSPKQQKHE